MITTKQVCPKVSKMTIYKAGKDVFSSSPASKIVAIAVSPDPLRLKSKNSSVFEKFMKYSG